MLWIFLDILTLFWILVLAMIGGMSQLDFITLLDRGFVVLLWVRMGGIGISVTLGIRIRWKADIIGHNFSLFHHIAF